MTLVFELFVSRFAEMQHVALALLHVVAPLRQITV